MTLTHHLLLFAAKLTLGLAGAMSLTSAKLVTSGFFRVHLWVILGLQVLATLAAYSLVTKDPRMMTVCWLTGATAITAYVGSVIWIYERLLAGRVALILTAILSASIGFALPSVTLAPHELTRGLLIADFLSSGLLLGAITTAMLLGHWYLNTPTMELAPLRQLLLLLLFAIILRALVALSGPAIALSSQGLSRSDWTFITLRWLSGIFAPLLLTKMTWETLKIPNTQSATGILYAGVILVFVGELVAQLLGAHWNLPV